MERFSFDDRSVGTQLIERNRNRTSAARSEYSVAEEPTRKPKTSARPPRFAVNVPAIQAVARDR